jgi:hypothetical protein
MLFCCGLCNVCFATASQNGEEFRVKLGESATNTYENIQKAFGNDSLSRAQAFGGTKTLQMGEKRWRMNRYLDAPSL